MHPLISQRDFNSVGCGFKWRVLNVKLPREVFKWFSACFPVGCAPEGGASPRGGPR